MKNIISLFLAILLFSCNKEKEIKQHAVLESIPIPAAIDSSSLTKIEFEQQLIDLGDIDEGIAVDIPFPFKNTGEKPLFISSCKGSGGFFVPSWKDTIPVGGMDTLFAKFYTRNRKGEQKKNITCTSNTDPRNTILKIKAYVTNYTTKIKFDYYEFDAGEIEEGTTVEYEFPFTNTGEYPLVIRNCRSSCGCVVPYCPKEPIPVGGTGIFSAKFNTKGKKGVQHKNIMMDANIKPPIAVLKLKATIIPRK